MPTYSPPELSVLTVCDRDGPIGTAFVVRRWGREYAAVTCWHVAGSERHLAVCGVPATVLGASQADDIALLGFRHEAKFRPVSFARPRRGQSARMFGYPHYARGRLCEYAGNISAVSAGPIWFVGGAAPACSGAPLVDRLGRVVGMVNGVYVWRGLCFDTAVSGLSAERIHRWLRAWLPT